MLSGMSPAWEAWVMDCSAQPEQVRQPRSWAKNYVDYLVAKGAISGNGAGKFLPKDNMTREQALKVAVSALGADTTAI